MNKATLVLGASPNPDRYSHKAIVMLREHHHPVVGIGNRKGTVKGITFDQQRPDPQQLEIDTVTLYLNAHHQRDYYDYILQLKPRRIIFNPGAENKELADLAHDHEIETLHACTLVLLSTGQY